ncbi:hypothetical protein HPULCUR_005563 [Helicostylum pulchrum]|uniref:Uncharacterized protein n=1 Tax=Helicostylum pulchrum TaxID=562976 RepID=A0ABP9Y0R7_9FUNG
MKTTRQQVHENPIERNNNTTNNQTPTTEAEEPVINNQPTEPTLEREFRSALLDIKDNQEKQIQQFDRLISHMSKSDDILKQIVLQLQMMT